MPTKEQQATTEKAVKLRQHAKNDRILSDMLGLSRVTIYKRLAEHSWKKSEMILIDHLYKEL